MTRQGLQVEVLQQQVQDKIQGSVNRYVKEVEWMYLGDHLGRQWLRMTSLFQLTRLHRLVGLPRPGSQEWFQVKDRKREREGIWSRNLPLAQVIPRASCSNVSSILHCLPRMSSEILRMHLSCQLLCVLLRYYPTLESIQVGSNTEGCHQSSSDLLPLSVFINMNSGL